jgi:4-diphosphocytidyl-2-C-methyl-D-erythritol kinase
MEMRTAQAPAKINLTLRITGVRADGFHELESLVAQINLCDTVSVAPHEAGCYALDCDDADLPSDGSNLVLQAARAINAAGGTNHGARISLKKRIPAGAGLGGGSSDAATTLTLLNEVWLVGVGKEELSRLAALLGSDVPLFLHTPLCVMRGRGERVEELGAPPPLWAALVLPEIHCATKAVYAAWDELRPPAAQQSLEDVLAARGSAIKLMELLFNDLEAAAFRAVPSLGGLAERIAEVDGRAVRLTGSGSALFRLFDDAPAAARFALVVGSELGVRVDVVALRA